MKNYKRDNKSRIIGYLILCSLLYYISYEIIKTTLEFSFYGEETIGFVHDYTFGSPTSECRMLYFYLVDNKLYNNFFDTGEANCNKHRIGEKYRVVYSRRNHKLSRLTYSSNPGKYESEKLDSIYKFIMMNR